MSVSSDHRRQRYGSMDEGLKDNDVANAEKQEFHRGSFTAPHVDLGLAALALWLTRFYCYKNKRAMLKERKG